MSTTSKLAVVLAGGLGSRLYPYTVSLPKPLLPVGNYPILEIIIRQLRKAGFEEIILAVNHQADIIKSYFDKGKKWEVEIRYSLENEPLGTMGPLKLLDDLPENILVMNGDILTDLDYRAFIQSHEESDAMFTISGYITTEKSQYGVLDVNRQTNRLTNFFEKPEQQLIVSMGIYGLKKAILDMIPEGIAFGFDDLMEKGLNEGMPIGVDIFQGYWRDLGTPEQYQQANDEFESHQQILGL